MKRPLVCFWSGKRDTHDRNPNSHASPRVTANGSPSRRHTPDGGWVTLAAAGLLARGSPRTPGLPGFPVARFGCALVAYSCEGSQGFDHAAQEQRDRPCSLLRPRREPSLFNYQDTRCFRAIAFWPCLIEQSEIIASTARLVQQTKPFELRAATDLARLSQAERQPQAVRQLIAPIYTCFTEGFDTADLMDTKALLDELS